MRQNDISQISIVNSQANTSRIPLNDQDPMTVNINVTFNEVNLSSDEEVNEVPDELDYNKRLQEQKQLLLAQSDLPKIFSHVPAIHGTGKNQDLLMQESGVVLTQQSSSIKIIKDKLAKKKKDFKEPRAKLSSVKNMGYGRTS